MPVAWYRKRPTMVRAVLFDGDNVAEIAEFLDYEFEGDDEPCEVLLVETTAGDKRIAKGEWVIKTLNSVTSCEPAEFADNYEPAED